eukprot:gene25109-biopygen10490
MPRHPGRDGRGRVPDASHTIEFEETDAPRTRPGRVLSRFSLVPLSGMPEMPRHAPACWEFPWHAGDPPGIYVRDILTRRRQNSGEGCRPGAPLARDVYAVTPGNGCGAFQIPDPVFDLQIRSLEKTVFVCFAFGQVLPAQKFPRISGNPATCLDKLVYSMCIVWDVSVAVSPSLDVNCAAAAGAPAPRTPPPGPKPGILWHSGRFKPEEDAAPEGEQYLQLSACWVAAPLNSVWVTRVSMERVESAKAKEKRHFRAAIWGGWEHQYEVQKIHASAVGQGHNAKERSNVYSAQRGWRGGVVFFHFPRVSKEFRGDGFLSFPPTNVRARALGEQMILPAGPLLAAGRPAGRPPSYWICSGLLFAARSASGWRERAKPAPAAGTSPRFPRLVGSPVPLHRHGPFSFLSDSQEPFLPFPGAFDVMFVFCTFRCIWWWFFQFCRAGGAICTMEQSVHQQLCPPSVGPGRVSGVTEGWCPELQCGEWVCGRRVASPGGTCAATC